MTLEPQLLQKAKDAFNSIRLMRGQVAMIATCNEEGYPNVAPIGSMRVVSDDTVHVLLGMLPRTMQNLKGNPRAAFSIVTPFGLRSLVEMLRQGPDTPSGYRLYCEYLGMDDKRVALEGETRELVKRLPWFLRRAFARFCDENLKRVLKFKIVDVRTI